MRQARLWASEPIGGRCKVRQRTDEAPACGDPGRMFTPSPPLRFGRGPAAASARREAVRALQGLLAAPFDLLRLQYAGAVGAGWVRRSLLASARLERSIHALETLVLGPLARQR